MGSVRSFLKSFIASEPVQVQVQEDPNQSFIDRIVNGPLSELRHRLSRMQRASLVLLVSGLLAIAAWGIFLLVSHHYVLDATISHLQIPQSVYEAVESVPAARNVGSGAVGLSDVVSPIQGMASSMVDILKWIGTVVPILMGVYGVYLALMHENFAGLIGAIVMGLACNVIVAFMIGENDNSGNSTRKDVPGAHELRAAVEEGNFGKVRSLVEAAQIPIAERQYVVAQLDLVSGSTGTLAQKAVAGSLRKGDTLTVADGHWMYAMEHAADGHVESKEALNYKLNTLKTAQAWREAAVAARNLMVAIAFAFLALSIPCVVLRRRVARISNLLEILA